MKTILNIITLIVVAVIGYIVWKAYQTASAASSAAGGAVSSAATDVSSAVGAVHSFLTNPLGGVFSDDTSGLGIPSLPSGGYYSDQLYNAPSPNAFGLDPIPDPTFVGGNVFGF